MASVDQSVKKTPYYPGLIPKIPDTNMHVFDIETEFAGHLMIPASAEYFMREGISLKLIHNNKIQDMWNWVQQHHRKSGKFPTDEVMRDKYPDFQFKVVNSEPHYVAERLKQRYKDNELESLVRDLAEAVKDDPAGAMNILRAKFIEVERNSLSEQNVWRSGDSTIFLNSMMEKILAGNFRGASFGWKQVDNFTGGLRAGQLGFIVARPKRKKTFCTIKAFIEQANEGWNPMFVTMENSVDEIMMRMSCMLSGFPWDQAQRGDFDAADKNMMQNAWRKFEEEKEFFIVAPDIGDRSVAALTVQADKLGAKSMLISQFSYLEGMKEFVNDWQSRAEVVLSLKNAANRPDNPRPIFVEAQLNREKDVALTDAIKQRADIVFELDFTKDQESMQQTELKIMESRNTGYKEWVFFSEFIKETRMEMLDGN